MEGTFPVLLLARVCVTLSHFAHVQDIAIEAVKGIVILAVLETLMLSRPVSWLEVRVAPLFVVFVRIPSLRF